jgi:hypothetical protein
MQKQTVGLSSKLIGTLIGACGAQLVAFVVNLISSGEFDRTEAAQLVGLALTAVFGVIVGYIAQPDQQALKPVDGGEQGQGLVEILLVLLIVLVVLVVLFRFL